ncbi:hypothetical protein ZP9_00011 [Shewanella phage ZP9]|nr:hypothetical protein ZP9_00011 [Shewanella phage ZP9]
MANQYLVDSPYSPFTIKNQFKAISNGKVYIGEIDKDPLNPSQQIQVYVVDETGVNVPISQPIQLNSGGYLVYNGQVSKFITLEPYSMVVLNNVNAEVWRVDDISKVDPDNITASNVRDTTNGGSVQDFIDVNEQRTSLKSLTPVTNNTQKVNHFYTDQSGSGGSFVYLPNTPQSQHNGGTIFSAQAISDWNGTIADLSTLLNRTDTGNGCYHRMFDIGLTEPNIYPDFFGANYVDGVSQSLPIQACENYTASKSLPLRLRAKPHHIGEKITISRAPFIISDGGGYGVTSTHVGNSQKRAQGTMFVSGVVGDYCLLVSPPVYEFGGEIRGLTVTGKPDGGSKITGKGVRLHNFGWTASITGLNVLDFDGIGLDIGYLQDTHFNQCSVLGCSKDTLNPNLLFTSNANYIYFNGCHIEDADYLLNVNSVDKPWEIHFDKCHFENGDYNGALGAEFDHDYSSATMKYDGCYRWYFTNTTFVPCSVARLKSVNGGDNASQPYFIQSTGVRAITHDNCTWISPRNNSGIDAISLSGDFTNNTFTGCNIEGAQGAKYTVALECGNWVGGSIDFNDTTEPLSYGVSINKGFIDKVRWGNNAGVAKTAGYLIGSSVNAGLVSGEHRYELTTRPFKYLNQFVASTDNRVNGYVNLTNNQTLDLEDVQPDQGFYNGTAGLVLANIINIPRSKEIFIRNDSPSMTINGSTTVKPTGANNLTVPAYAIARFKADHTGVCYEV